MSTMKPRERTEWAKEEIADALRKWLAERLQGLDVQEVDDSDALKTQTSRVLKFLGQSE